MRSFIDEVIDDIWPNYENISAIIFVLPSKRAGNFLKKAIAQKAGTVIISPIIYSIEEFVEKVSGLSYANNTQQLFELYEAYLRTGTFSKDSFDTFFQWAQTLLQDINEIDRYLIDSQKLFSGLSDIQEITHWSVSSKPTEMMVNYLNFWKHLGAIYENFNSNLSNKALGHQGLVYRKAFEKIPLYLQKEPSPHIFLGFNALNTSESHIIQTILENSNSRIYWDIDAYFLNDPVHDAGLFIRQHKKSWGYFSKNKLKGISDHYLSKKDIEVIGVPKNVSQAKYVGTLLCEINATHLNGLKNTAVILANENLLNPLLNAVPKEITSINITMGQKLEATPMASFFMDVISLLEAKTPKGWFYKDFLNFILHPLSAILLQDNGVFREKLITLISERNLIYVTLEFIQKTFQEPIPFLTILFSGKESNPMTIIDKNRKLILLLKEKLSETKDHMALEQLYKFHNLFNQVQDIISKYSYVSSVKAFKSLFGELLSPETLDFQGDPMEGLQIMGMLESRNLDFETVILTSVNEGILPSGKSHNSFIPFDLKIEYGLPTYKEKDAVYTYHFYRLLQRAKNVYLIYNTEPDVLEGGEKSRLITQLLTDGNRTDIIEKIAAPSILPVKMEREQITKTASLHKMILDHAQKGFSPSSLSNYIRNPMDFYKQNILGIDKMATVEETLAANTFGSIVHDSLEQLYTPFVGKELSKALLLHAKTKIEGVVTHNFKKTYLDGDISSGKNYLSYHVIIKYIQNFIDMEIVEAEKHSIKIIGLEQKLNISLSVPEIGVPVILKGKLDRIDECDGITRIIDYKTGKVEPRNVEIMDWDTLTKTYDYSKAFQLLCYSLMYKKSVGVKELQAGIISLKNMGEGTMLFAKKESVRGAKNNNIETDVLNEFEQYLFGLIQEICNPEIPFTEKIV
ncbi:PD-(D/E)XK nuclease family protein [Maribacter sp. 2304DJ31-5]|uniref:PD-(D/E)XK nuclease family protein n=1 Tax=Maribacter sp. 2304DJ31-5 TaxID=3386273 RepID=UPI0039BCE99A